MIVLKYIDLMVRKSKLTQHKKDNIIPERFNYAIISE
jgi:hypothetical protein